MEYYVARSIKTIDSIYLIKKLNVIYIKKLNINMMFSKTISLH